MNPSGSNYLIRLYKNGKLLISQDITTCSIGSVNIDNYVENLTKRKGSGWEKYADYDKCDAKLYTRESLLINIKWKSKKLLN
jgi:hypothetical protein